ncbi:MAG TPA: Fe-S cluster assembly protein SufD [Chromatiaceae bacterium]|nr:MAG: Fe-S cluster assembly protein SufD [Thiohalocapsa sp. PB-PSB1]HBG93955.1 Fe-S cluster assembly protein SufD [Chromatiaceae bacterium]HCS91415.1 Fe-S cluster assembly protein SufD [Chromatiaceae bacterium]
MTASLPESSSSASAPSASLSGGQTSHPPGKSAIGDALASWLRTSDENFNGAPSWLQTERDRALQRIAEQGIPDAKSEAWRYTGLRTLMQQNFQPVGELTAIPLPQEEINHLLIPGLDAHRIIMVNGRFAVTLSNLSELPSGVRIASLRDTLTQDPDALDGLLTRIAGEGSHVFASLNTAGMDDGLVLLVDRGVLLDRPIELIHLSVGTDKPHVAQPRHLVHLNDGAQAELIERSIGLNESTYCSNSLLEISLGRDARLKHRRIQMESENAFHICGLHLLQGQGSHYAGVNVSLGGAWARNDLVVRFSGEHAECDLNGLYLAGDKQLVDFHLDVRHNLPNCTSRENFKGIVHGKGKAVFDGLVYVARNAQKTDADMSNRNLILSQNAEVDTKPQLEIYADDVKCSHGTTVGQIEPEMLFYLRSRGISALLARRMLCLGFAGEIIDALGNEALQDHAAEHVGSRLERSPL